MCTTLDVELEKGVAGSRDSLDKTAIKEQMLRMADMLNNKVYILEHQKCITPEQKDQIVSRFNKVFNQALMEYGIGALTQEDIEKTSVSSMDTYKRLKNGETIEQILGQASKQEHTQPNLKGMFLDGIIQQGQEIYITDDEITNAAREINNLDREITQDREQSTSGETRDD